MKNISELVTGLFECEREFQKLGRTGNNAAIWTITTQTRST